MKFIVSLILGWLLFPILYPFLTAHGTGVIVSLAVIAALAAVPYYLPRKAWVALALLWVAWSFSLPIWRSVHKAIVNGLNTPGQLLAAAKAGGLTALGKMVGKGVAIPAKAAVNVSQAQDEINLAEDLCESLSFVQNKLGDPLTTTYCQGQDNGMWAKLKSYFDAAASAGAGPAYPFLANDPARLNTQPYYTCLAGAVSPQGTDSPTEAAARSESKTNAVECDSKYPRQAVPIKWRLCMELALEAPYFAPPAASPLAPEIKTCRASVHNP